MLNSDLHTCTWIFYSHYWKGINYAHFLRFYLCDLCLYVKCGNYVGYINLCVISSSFSRF